MFHVLTVNTEEGSLKEIQKDHERVLSAWVKGQRSLQDMKSRYKVTNFKVCNTDSMPGPCIDCFVYY